MIPFGVHHGLGKPPYLPLQILGQSTGVNSRMVMIGPRNHIQVMNNDLSRQKRQYLSFYAY